MIGSGRQRTSGNRWVGRIVAGGLLLLAVVGCAREGSEPWTGARWPTPLDLSSNETAAQWTIEVLDEFPHDAQAFTQGLERLGDEQLLESLGLRGRSEIRIVGLADGDVVRSVPLPTAEFGEGVTVHQGTAVQLTWKAGVAHRWTVPDLTPLSPWRYAGEGWGLCAAGAGFVMSNGSADLTYRSFDDFSVTSTVTVTLNGEPVDQLNELECVDGVVVANVWRHPELLIIDPGGAVIAVVDASALTDRVTVADPAGDVLNGIAAEPGGTFLLTGKHWPTVFRVALVADQR